MSTINSVLDIAKTALLTTQKAINVTSHNISNANTPGYTRQRAVLETTQPVNYGGLFFGTGVNVENIERIYDSFQTLQLRSASSGLSRYSTSATHLASLESIMNDFDGSGLSARLDAFFNSFQDVATNPASYGERAALLSNSAVLADTFGSVSADMTRNISAINRSMEAKIDEVNSLAARIAELNQQISASETSGVSSNDLRDKRDLLLDKLAGFMNISVMENSSGQVDVYIEGSFLVAGVKTSELSLAINGSNPEVYDIMSNGTALNARLTGGSLMGDLEGIERYQGIRDKVNLLAATLVKEVNLQHSQGYGLDGSTGTGFFTPLSVYTRANTANTGGGIISGGLVTDLSLLTLDDYEVRFSGPGSYSVINLSTQSVVSSGAYSSGSAMTFDGISVTVTDDTGAPAAGDRFRVSAKDNAAANIDVSITDTDKVAAASAPGGAGDNRNALLLSALRDGSVMDGATFNEYYNGIVTELGVAVREAKVNTEASSSFVEELQAARESTSGVSIEEEAINLVKLQRAYEAAAKVMRTADEMLQTVLNLV